MRTFLARRMLNAFSRRYNYDTGYARHILNVAPGAFFKLARLAPAAQHRSVVPARAARAAALVAALAEDCGDCVQLAVAQAREAGLSDGEIEAVLTDARSDLPAVTACAADFARALVGDRADLPTAREVVRARWGDAGVVDLTLACQLSRLFPMVKTGLGYRQACQRIAVSERAVRPELRGAA